MRVLLLLPIALIVTACGAQEPPPPTPTSQERESIRSDFALAFEEVPPQHSQFRVQWSTDEKDKFVWVATKNAVRYTLGDCSPGVDTYPPSSKCVKAFLPNTSSHTMYNAVAVCAYRDGFQTEHLPIGDVPPGDTATWEWTYIPNVFHATDFLCTLAWLPYPIPGEQ